MAPKPVKKKAAPKGNSGASAGASTGTAGLTAKPKSASSVVPFNPLNGMRSSDFSTFNQSIPSLGGSFETMETTMTNLKNQYEKLSEEASCSIRDSVESMSKSTATFAKGAEQILKTLTEAAQGSSQRNAEALKALMATRTLNEFAEAQNKLAQQNFEEAMSTMTKLSEMTIKLCSEALEPINGQMTKAMTSAMNAAKKNAA